MDPRSESRLALVNSQLAEKVKDLAVLLAAEGIEIRVTQGLRSWGEQEALYAQGRTLPGPIVTNAMPGYSWHNFGLAVDVAPFDAAGQPDWNAADPAWRKIITLGESIGLYSGDEFLHCKDEPHFQLTGKFPVSPNNQARELLAHLGTDAVWKAAGL
jgi:peptidoglycan L-alanyl-D-glutamate endopeptidase CwlK